MTVLVTETIVALASGAGKSGVAVIRASGPRALAALATLAGPLPAPRRATVRRLRSLGGDAIDDALVLGFPAPASFTGEDVAEFHVHGGSAVIAATLQALCEVPGVRLARPGEFTRRAVENGRLDLVRAEGIADLVEAETAQQRRQALAQAGGLLETAATTWRSALVETLSLAEAEIDFPDEGDVPRLLDEIRRRGAAVLSGVKAALSGAARGERVRRGARFAIAGPPNAGKSTLLNALARRDVAIVSTHAGTTRDAIEVHTDLQGLPVTFIDTAGLRETADPVEAIGVERALTRAREADLVIWLSSVDASAEPPAFDTPILRVRTKADIDSQVDRSEDAVVSVMTGEGMAELDASSSRRPAPPWPEARMRWSFGPGTGTSSKRWRAISGASPTGILANRSRFIAEDLRLAVRAIGRLTGRVDIDEVYDVIFSSFCIGK